MFIIRMVYLHRLAILILGQVCKVLKYLCNPILLYKSIYKVTIYYLVVIECVFPIFGWSISNHQTNIFILFCVYFLKELDMMSSQTIQVFKFVIFKKISRSVITFLIQYVDNILLIRNDIPMLTSVKMWLSKKFSMKDLGEASYILEIKNL